MKKCECGFPIIERGVWPIRCGCGRVYLEDGTVTTREEFNPDQKWMECKYRGEKSDPVPCRICGQKNGMMPTFHSSKYNEIVALKKPITPPGKEPFVGRNCLDCVAEDEHL